MEKLTGQKIAAKLKTQAGQDAVLRGWEKQIANGTLKPKGLHVDPTRRHQGAFEVFEGSGYTLLRGPDGSLRSVMESSFDMVKRLVPLQWSIIP